MIQNGYDTEDIDDLLSDEDAKELYAYFGRAIYVSNILEHGIVNALFVIQLLPRIRDFNSQNEWGDAVEDFFSSQFEMTLGQLANKLEKTGIISVETIEIIMNSKIVRNFLVHHFNRENADQFYSKTGRNELKDECSNAVKVFDIANTLLDEEIAPMRSLYGIDQGWLENKYREGIERLKGQQST